MKNASIAEGFYLTTFFVKKRLGWIPRGGGSGLTGQRSPRIACFCLAVLLLTFSTVSAQSGETQIEGIQKAIKQQLMAFNNNDYKAAYRYASKAIQSVFSLVEFETMVRSGYPQIDKSRKVDFGEILLSEDLNQALAKVRITGMDHSTLRTQYQMILEGGAWKNNGVVNLDVIESIPIQSWPSKKRGPVLDRFVNALNRFGRSLFPPI